MHWHWCQLMVTSQADANGIMALQELGILSYYHSEARKQHRKILPCNPHVLPCDSLLLQWFHVSSPQLNIHTICCMITSFSFKDCSPLHWSISLENWQYTYIGFPLLITHVVWVSYSYDYVDMLQYLIKSVLSSRNLPQFQTWWQLHGKGLMFQRNIV